MKAALYILLFLLVSAAAPAVSQELYTSAAVKVSIFSSAPIEDIQAVSNQSLSIIEAQTGAISFQVDIRDFQFQKAKMQEHFNENFMDSHTYPTATFKGNIRNMDWQKPGVQQVILQGVLKVHGVPRKREIPASLQLSNGSLLLKSKFEVACVDHDIEIPRILWKNIAEIIEVQVAASYKKMKK